MDQLLATCEAAARAGAAELIAWRGRVVAREKGPADLVTEADLASQAAIRAEIVARFPHHQLFAEEQANQLSAIEQDEHVWLVDPLDGTTNYVHGYPCFTVSVAVASRRELLAGVIYDPLRDECFAARRGA